jgi:hypothetical protein
MVLVRKKEGTCVWRAIASVLVALELHFTLSWPRLCLLSQQHAMLGPPNRAQRSHARSLSASAVEIKMRTERLGSRAQREHGPSARLTGAMARCGKGTTAAFAGRGNSANKGR